MPTATRRPARRPRSRLRSTGKARRPAHRATACAGFAERDYATAKHFLEVDHDAGQIRSKVTGKTCAPHCTLPRWRPGLHMFLLHSPSSLQNGR